VHGAAAGVAKLPVTARALVAASPTVTHDGAVVVGSRTSSAWALDARAVCVARARGLLSTTSRWRLDDFMAAWQAGSPEARNTRTPQLLGLAVRF
jgi:hypothetical protein